MTNNTDVRQDAGRFGQVYSDEDLLEAVEDLDGMASTAEVSRALECNYDTARTRLIKLDDKGLVHERRFGNARAWLLTDEGEALIG